MIRQEGPEETFTELVNRSVAEVELDISPVAKSYVVEVLCSFVRRPLQLNVVELIDLLRDGLSAEGSMRVEYLRVTGDLAMVVSGVFPDSLERKQRRYTINLGDIMDIGQEAYTHIYREPYEELAYSFPEIIDALHGVSGKISIISQDLEKYISRRRYIDVRIARR